MNSLILNKLSLINYKNIDSKAFVFDYKINCFVGDNGVGKTNVLDSIYHLAMTKSYFNSVTSQSINHKAEFMVIEGNFKKGNKSEKIISSLKKGQRKTFKRNGKIYKKFSDHIGLIPVVMISPYDRDLIQEGSSNRRKFIDNVISQNNKTYLNVKKPRHMSWLFLYRRRDLNPHGHYCPLDFKSNVSTNSTTSALVLFKE